MPVRPTEKLRPRRASGHIGPLPYAERVNIARVFKKSPSHEAEVYVIRTQKHARVFFRTEPNERRVIRKFIVHSIFHALFPKISIKPIGVVVATINGRQRLGMVSNIVRPRSASYKKYQKQFYDARAKDDLDHFTFALPHYQKKFDVGDESGIEVNVHPVNIINSDGNPIFIEVEGIYSTSRHKMIAALLAKNINASELERQILRKVPERYRNMAQQILKSIY